jgi:5-methylcytosine-specific restriction endonuclease McrA
LRKALREQVRQKFDNRCGYTGTVLLDDWQVDHIVPKRLGGTDSMDNLMPCQKIVNHYKRALTLQAFRVKWLGGLHRRLAKLPKCPRTANSSRRKGYLLRVAELFRITADRPFSGKFYFEWTAE